MEAVWHLFVIRCADRDRLQAYLQQQQIGTMLHYPRACHLQGAFAHYEWPPLPVAVQLQSEILSLPIAPYMTAQDVKTVADAVRSFYA